MIQTGRDLATQPNFQFSMTFNFNIFQCFSNIRNHLSNFSYLVCISCKFLSVDGFICFWKLKICVALPNRVRSVWAFKTQLLCVFYYHGFVYKCATKYRPTIRIVNILIWNNRFNANYWHVNDLFMHAYIIFWLCSRL
jgi:hypothetical protein